MTETFDLTLEQARAYEAVFVPALFEQWVEPLLACAGVADGHRVLDVACGTGVVARGAARVVGPRGHVTGIDLNPAMIEVARGVRPDGDWDVGDAAHLPYDDASFDAVLCQSALFFFPEPAAAVREMARVVAPGGSVAVQTYAGLDEQPGYGPFVDVVARHAGREARALLGTYWSWGDVEDLSRLLRGAGLDVGRVLTVPGTVTFPSVGALVDTEIAATPLAARVTASALGAVVEDARVALGRYTEPSGALRLPVVARLVGGRRPA